MNRNSPHRPALVGDRPAGDPLPPPAHLDGVGLELWRSISSQYAFDDPGSYEVLSQACFAARRADRARAIIDEQGEMLEIGKVVRSHPLIRDEIQCRALCARLLGKLGLDLEPVGPQRGAPHPRGR